MTCSRENAWSKIIRLRIAPWKNWQCAMWLSDLAPICRLSEPLQHVGEEEVGHGCQTTLHVDLHALLLAIDVKPERAAAMQAV